MKKNEFIKRHLKRRRHEKIKRFVKLPTFVFCIVFLFLSASLLLVSYFVNEKSTWLSGVLVSMGCGIITGVILYFLSNMRSSKVQALQSAQSELYEVYTHINDVIFEIYAYRNSELLEMEIDVFEESICVVGKLETLLDTIQAPSEMFEKTEGLDTLYDKIGDILSDYDTLTYNKLNDDTKLKKWFDDIVDVLHPIKVRMEKMMGENGDQLGFMRKYIF